MTRSKPYQCIHQLFERQASVTPGSVAIEFNGRQITYAELNRCANQLTNRLRREGVRQGNFVGVFVERSPEMVIALLAILKSGAAFVPLDISSPKERLAFMIQDAGVDVILTSSPLYYRLPDERPVVVCQDLVSDDGSLQDVEDLKLSCGPEQVAYVIYTSGSTGRPKGVISSHSTLLKGLYWMWESYPFEESEVCCQTRVLLSLIDSIWEIFLPLLKGVRLAFISEPILTDLPLLIDTLSEKQVTRIAMVPSLLRLLLESCENLENRIPSLRLWMSSGEPLGRDVAESFLRLLPRSHLLNLYGLSEVPDVTYYDVSSWSPHREGASIPIGFPVQNTNIHILDSAKNLVPSGETGELHIGGEGISLGYLGRPDLTAERFIPDLTGSNCGGRLYNTGDLARYGADGALEFFGRKDLQVNVHGFRVEIGEIEFALAQHTDIRQGVVVAKQDRSKESHLVAYILLKRKNAPSSQALRAFLKNRLPDHMIPVEFVMIDSLPFTRSGKVDRLALSKVQPNNNNDRPITQPSDLLELQITAIWDDVLGTGPISISDNFFDLGGDSFSALRIVNQIHEQFGQMLPLSALVELGSIDNLAKMLSEKIGSLPYSPITAIRKTGSRTPFFLVHGIGGEVLEFYDLARHLGADQPFYGLQAPLATEPINANISIEETAAEYCEAIHKVQAEGPYFLGGYSWGGGVAFEIAQQLVALNQQVALLAIIDAEPLNVDSTSQSLDRLWEQLAGNEHLLRMDDRLSSLDPEGQFKREIARLELEIAHEGITEEFGEAYKRNYARGFVARTRALHNYKPRVFTGEISLFKAEQNSLQSEANDGAVMAPVQFESQWSQLTTMPLQIYRISGDHWNILREPNVQALAKQIRHSIDRALKS
jgi:amino acid adenylation domain-containing protein